MQLANFMGDSLELGFRFVWHKQSFFGRLASEDYIGV